MALVGKSFAEQYLALVSRQPTDEEFLARVMREEHGARKSIEDEYRNRVEDIFFQIGVMNSDRKMRSNLGSAAAANSRSAAGGGAAGGGRADELDAAGNRRALVSYDKRTLAVMERENAVWLPAVPPRQVVLPTARRFRAFPHAAYRKLADEEAELRDWLIRVQDRLREALEQQRGERYYIVMCLMHCEESEQETRRKMEINEEDEFRMIRRRQFRDAPSSLFRRLAKQKSREKRLQQSMRRQLTNEDGAKAEFELDSDSYLLDAYHEGIPLDMDSIEVVERLVREEMEEEQNSECASIYQWLQDMYGVRIFSTRRKEISARDNTANAWACGLWNDVITPACIDTFGPDHQILGAAAWHVSDSKLPLLRALTSQVASEYAKVKPPPPAPSASTAVKAANPSSDAVFGRMFGTLHGVAHSSADSSHNQLLQSFSEKASSGAMQPSTGKKSRQTDASASSRMYSTLQAVANHSSENSRNSLLQSLSEKASAGALQHEENTILRSSPPTSENGTTSTPAAGHMYSTLETVARSSLEHSRNPLLQSLSEKATAGALQHGEKVATSSPTQESRDSAPTAGHMYSALEAVAKNSSESSRNPLLQSLSEKATSGALQHEEKTAPHSPPAASEEYPASENRMYTVLEAVASTSPGSADNSLLQSLSKKASTGALKRDSYIGKTFIPKPPTQSASVSVSDALDAPNSKKERASSLSSDKWYDL